MEFFAREVDPRDVGVEIASATFRARLWRCSASAAKSPGRSNASWWRPSDWELSGVQVQDVLRWLDGQLGPADTAEVFVLLPDDQGPERTLLRIAGVDPTTRY